MRACEGPLKSGVQDCDPKSARAQSVGEMQRQRALADSTLAGPHGHQMAHGSEPVSDAGALLGNLLEDPGPSVADDILIALHDSDVAYQP